MATIYSSANDGWIKAASNVSWSDNRDATAGDALSSSDTRLGQAVSALAFSGRGATEYRVIRSFFEFDTSGISSAPDDATLKIFGYNSTAADFFVVKSTQSASLALADFDAITGWSAGVDNSSNVTKYSVAITSWSSSAYNDITLNATALSDMASLDTFKICLIEEDYDLANSAPSGSSVSTGLYYADNSGTSNDPYVDYTAATVATTDNAIFFGVNF